MSEVIRFPAAGLPLADAREAIKLETLDRIVEVVSGNTPHASSVPLRQMIAKAGEAVKGDAT